jgi:hypothetical protein
MGKKTRKPSPAQPRRTSDGQGTRAPFQPVSGSEAIPEQVCATAKHMTCCPKLARVRALTACTLQGTLHIAKWLHTLERVLPAQPPSGGARRRILATSQLSPQPYPPSILHFSPFSPVFAPACLLQCCVVDLPWWGGLCPPRHPGQPLWSSGV